MYNQETDYNSFKKQLPELLRSHSGKFVVFHKGDLDSSFEARTDALQYARETSLVSGTTLFRKFVQSTQNQLHIRYSHDQKQSDKFVTTTLCSHFLLVPNRQARVCRRSVV